MSLPWKGNVRELDNVIEHTMILAEGELAANGSIHVADRAPAEHVKADVARALVRGEKAELRFRQNLCRCRRIPDNRTENRRIENVWTVRGDTIHISETGSVRARIQREWCSGLQHRDAGDLPVVCGLADQPVQDLKSRNRVRRCDQQSACRVKIAEALLVAQRIIFLLRANHIVTRGRRR